MFGRGRAAEVSGSGLLVPVRVVVVRHRRASLRSISYPGSPSPPLLPLSPSSSTSLPAREPGARIVRHAPYPHHRCENSPEWKRVLSETVRLRGVRGSVRAALLRSTSRPALVLIGPLRHPTGVLQPQRGRDQPHGGDQPTNGRSEERRVGKERRTREAAT